MRSLALSGAVIGIAGATFGQVDSTSQVAPAGGGCVMYDNQYTGLSTYADAAQTFEAAFESYDIWLGDDFEISEAFTNIELTSVGSCTNGCVDPFAVTDFAASIWDGLPNDDGTSFIMQSTGFSFDGVDAWTASFGEQTLEAGQYVFTFAADLDFGDGRTFFFQQPREGVNDGFLWNPGQAFGFTNDIFMILDASGAPSSPNACINGDPVSCTADCDGNGDLNVLDFVCFQQAWVAQSPKGDCDGNGVYDVLDFVCFQGEFTEGCD